jgi:ubiquinone/menaquinone biosynthesis C-methylase UbiE
MNEWDKKRDVMKRYNLTAHIYDMQYAEEQNAKIQAVMQNIKMEKESSVLDVGCGTGLLFNCVANKAKTIVGLDISRKILLQAKERTKKFPNVHLILADADNMPLKEGTFSHLFAITLIQNVPSPFKTLNEVKRVTQENAFMVVTGLKKKFSVEVFKSLLQNASLNVITLKSESLKCYVAVCTKFLH